MSGEFHGDDYLDGEKGADTLLGGGGNDTLFGGEDDDMLHGDSDGLDVQFHGSDVLDGGAGNDTLAGGGGNDQLFGGTGDDLMAGDAGDDQLSGGEGMDQLQGGAGSDSLYGQAGDDVLFGEAGADLLVGDAGNDQMLGGEGDDQLYGGSGDDILLGEAGNDVLDGGGGEDYLDGGDGDDTYVFNPQKLAEAVTAHGEIKYGVPITDAQRTLVTGFEGLMVIADASGANKILFSGDKASAGLTFLTVQDRPNDFALRYGDQGVVYIKDGLTHEAISSLGFSDGQTLSRADIMKLAPALTIGGTANADHVIGGSQADSISGGDGDDRLAGGKGNDTLSGGNGSDTYVFNPGDGQDQIDNNAADNTTVTDTIELGAGIAVGDVVVNRVASDLVLKIGASDSVTVKAYFLLPEGSRKLVQIRFADSTVWSQADIEQRMVIPGATEGNDTLGGFDTNDVIHGLGGNDVISGNAGDDELYGEEGNDSLNGGAGNDTLDGGSGDDSLSGSAGSDTYLFGRGAGHDTIFDYGEDADDVDTVIMAADLAPGDIVVKRVSNSQGLPNDLRLHLSKGPGIATFDDSVLVQNFFAFQDNRSKIEQVRFADDSVWTAPMLKAMVDAVTGDNDSVLGYAWDDTLNGEGGDDTLRGYGGNDNLSGGAGKDTLYGDEGGDLLFGGAGNDVLEGGQGNDLLDGGADSDTLNGYAGNDTYVLGRGYGNDRVWEASLPGGSFDTVQLGENITPAEFALCRHGDDLVIALTSGQDQLWIGSFFIDSENGQISDHKIEQIKFADGTTWDLNTIAANVIAGTQNAMTGTAGNDTFTVDHVFDTVTEAANQGVDTVRSWVSHTLSANVENLTLTGVLNIAGRGNDLDNVIAGNSGNNYLAGGKGADTLNGGAGDDIYGDFSQPEDDVVIEAAGEGIDTIMSAYGGAIPDNVENFTLTSDYASVHDVTGNALDNVITGNYDNNLLDGGAGADSLIGKQGNDIYVVDNVADKVIEEAGAGTDTVRSSVSHALGSNLENLILLGGASIDGFGNDLNNVLNGSSLGEPLGSSWQWYTGNTGANVLYGGKGNDQYMLGEGDTAVEKTDEGIDTINILYEPAADISLASHVSIENLNMQYSKGNWNLHGTDADNILTGGGGNNVIEGGSGNDRLFGLKGNDWLDGGAGDDIMQGELGDDTYVVDSAGDQVYEDASYQGYFGGVDTVRSSISYKLGANLEKLVLTGNDAIDGEGNALNNTLDGSGNSAANVLTGGSGNDTYIVGEGDSIIETADGGIDTIVTAVSHALSNEIENVVLSGMDDINATGDAADNQLTGNAGANILAGGAGNDTLSGGAGNDKYVFNTGDGRDRIDNSADDNLAAVDAILLGDGIAANAVTLERVGDDLLLNISATDGVTVSAYFSVDADRKIDQIKFADGTIWDQGEIALRTAPQATSGDDVLVGTAGYDTIHGLGGNDAISGGAGDDLLYGDEGADTLNGEDGNDLLDGGTRSDAMRGGAGNDRYIVDAAGDVVTEYANEGVDTVESSVSTTLGSNVENLVLTGIGQINGTGNALDNILAGNAAANILKGGKGNDTYHVGTGDTVTEISGEGIDTVVSDVTWTLAANLENLTLGGTAAINGSGNFLANILIGNSANNALNGGYGADIMSGGAGNDTYTVDNTGDVVVENAGEGMDEVKSSITFTLSSNVEALTLTGISAVNGIGNDSDNLIKGNSANNTLNGNAGIDLLQGGGGADKLTDTSGNNLLGGGSGGDIITGGTGRDFIAGGTGNDTIATNTGADIIAFNRGDGQDSVAASTGKDNTLSLGKGIRYADLLFKKSTNDLVLVTGTSEQITFKNWYTSTDNRSVGNLQMVIEGTTDYSASSTNKLNNRKIVQFDFDGLAAKFDQARAANSSLTSWRLSSSLLGFYLSGSDTAAIGGDLAYRYAKNGNLSSLSMTPAQALLADTQFGTASQNLLPTSALQDSSMRLM